MSRLTKEMIKGMVERKEDISQLAQDKTPIILGVNFGQEVQGVLVPLKAGAEGLNCQSLRPVTSARKPPKLEEFYPWAIESPNVAGGRYFQLCTLAGEWLNYEVASSGELGHYLKNGSRSSWLKLAN